MKRGYNRFPLYILYNEINYELKVEYLINNKFSVDYILFLYEYLPFETKTVCSKTHNSKKMK